MYIAPQLPNMPPQRRCRHRQSRRTVEAAAQARSHELWPVAIQPYVALVCRLVVSTSVIHVHTQMSYSVIVLSYFLTLVVHKFYIAFLLHVYAASVDAMYN